MFDLPRKVKEFSCMCCGERFWTLEGEAKLFNTEAQVRASVKSHLAKPAYTSAAHQN